MALPFRGTVKIRAMTRSTHAAGHNYNTAFFVRAESASDQRLQAADERIHVSERNEEEDRDDQDNEDVEPGLVLVFLQDVIVV